MLQVNTHDLEAIINQVITLQMAADTDSIFDAPSPDNVVNALEQHDTRQSLLNTAGCVLVANANVDKQANGHLFNVVQANEFFCGKRLDTFSALFEKIMGFWPTFGELVAAYNSIKPNDLRNKALRSKAAKLPAYAEATILASFSRHRIALNRRMAPSA